MTGRRLGEFRLLEELGRGGMGIVYKAYHPKLDRTVALKMIRFDRRSTADDVERFEREAQAAAKLNHKNIVSIHEIGIENDLHYFSMDFVPGTTLQALGRVRPYDNVAELCYKIASAAQHAHQQQILHRDLKPANILVDEVSEPHVTDFGLALKLDIDDRLTQRGDILGTPSYMSPEQADGSNDIGPASDIYAVGAVLYFMLTGKPPFETANVLTTLEQIKNSNPILPSQIDRTVPRDLETICLRCLNKAPEKRYLDAGSLADDLERFRNGIPIRARRVGSLERGRMWAKRHPAATLSLFLLGLIAVFVPWGLASWSGLADRFDVTENDRIDAQQRASQMTNLANQKSRIADRDKYSRLIREAHDNWQAGQHSMALLQLEQCPESERGWEWFYIQRLCQPATLCLGDPHQRCVAFNHTESWIASGGKGGVIEIWEAETGDELMRLMHPDVDDVSCVAFGANDIMASSGDRSIALWDSISRTPAAILKRHETEISCLVFDPSGTTMASGGQDGTIVWDVEIEQPVHHIEKPSRVTSLSINQNGALIAIAGSENQRPIVRIVDLELGTERAVIQPSSPVRSLEFFPNGDGLAMLLSDEVELWWIGDKPQSVGTVSTPGALSIAFNPNGRRLAVGSTQGIDMFDPATRQLMETHRGQVVTEIAYSIGGRYLASVGGTKGVHVWGDPGLVTMNDMNAYSSGEFSGDGRHFVGALFGSNQVHILDSQRSYLRVPGSGELVDAVTMKSSVSVTCEPINTRRESILAGQFGIAISPDGRTIATGHRTLVLWDAVTGEKRKALGKTDGDMWNLAFSPDAKLLASSGADGVKIWNIERAESSTTIPVQATGLSFSPDGARLAVSVPFPSDSASPANGQWVTVYATATGGQIHALLSAEDSQLPTCVAYGIRGERIAAATGDGTVLIWDAQSGELVHEIKAHESGCTGIAFNQDESRLVSAGVNGTIRVWNSSTAQMMLTLSGIPDRATAFLQGSAVRVSTPSSAISVNGRVVNRTAQIKDALTTGIGKSTVQFSRSGTRISSWGLSSRQIWESNPDESLAAASRGIATTIQRSESQKRKRSAPSDMADLPRSRTSETPPSDGSNDAAETGTVSLSDVVHHYAFDGNVRDSAGTAHGKIVGKCMANGQALAGSASLACRAGAGLNAVTVSGAAQSMSGGRSFAVALWFRSIDPTGRGLGMEGKVPRFLEVYQGAAGFAAGTRPLQSNVFLAVNPDEKLNITITRSRKQVTAPPGVWNHAVLMCDATMWSIYVNGKLAGERRNVAPLSLLRNVTIGGSRRGIKKPGNRDFNGTIDEVTVFNRALSQEEIKTLHNTPSLISDLIRQKTLRR